MRLDLKTLAQTDVLAGAVNGKLMLVRLLEATMSAPSEPEAVFLDFSGIAAATGSYLRESVLALRDIVRRRRSNLYPVIANPNEAVRDELGELAEARRDVFMTCVLGPDGEVISMA